MEEEEEANVFIKYPKHVTFIYLSELLERYSYYSFRTILFLYFYDVLELSVNEATVYFHCFIIIAYSMPLFGGWVADSLLGKFWTIAYFSVVYIVGAVFLTASSLASQYYLSGTPLSVMGLVFIAVGSGAMKPCIVPFGADQFVVPQQKKELDEFFSLFYWCINVGSLMACIFSPYIRSNVTCFGYEHCYPLAFTVAMGAMILALTMLSVGKKWYIIKKAHRNIVTQFFHCLGYGIWKKIKCKKQKNHWLDHADDKFSLELIEDTKTIVRIFTVMSPAIAFWALSDKQGSRWIFQAKALNGEIVEWFKIEPDQMASISSLLVLPAVPLFQKLVFPCMGKMGLCKSLLCRMSVGGYIMCATFLVAALLQFQVEIYKDEFKLSIAWQIPQYVILVVAEILFIISGTNFAYTQSPDRMKTLVTSLWFLTVSLGNILSCITVSIGIKNLAIEFIVDSSIMAFFVTVFTILANRFNKFSVDDAENVFSSELTITSRN